MASGDCLEGLRQQVALTEPLLRRHLHEAASPELAAQLLGDEWPRAIGTIMATMTAKLRYWEELPYVLCGLAHHDRAVAS